MAKKKNPAAVELGRRGGKKSAESLTEEQRKEKARSGTGAMDKAKEVAIAIQRRGESVKASVSHFAS
jgi:hypothetical protein